MNTLNAATLINLLGFAVGTALYGMLAVMVARHGRASSRGVNILLFTTAFLGLAWNIGELFIFIRNDFGGPAVFPFISAASYSALGFLPSVVVHSAQGDDKRTHLLTYAAYALSSFAAVLHFSTAIAGETPPSFIALQTLTFGSLTLAAGLLISNFRQPLEKKGIWTIALLVFAVSSFHLSGEGEGNSWLVELAAHQSSLPLALAILYQNYRFAFADLFLKRAISLLLLALVAFLLYVSVASPLLRYHETHDRNDVLAIGLIITLWIGTALVYPLLHRLAVWLVDRVILSRPDYEKFQLGLASDIETIDGVEEVLDTVRDRLAVVLTAGDSKWSKASQPASGPAIGLVKFADGRVSVTAAATELPNYEFVFSGLHGGRQLLSEETAMLEAAGTLTARRIDALRISHERYEREFREQEFSKLATEAQLTALRSQVNPHFLFNALTTIGYLIQTSPDKAFATLLHLTKLLRGVLGKTSEFSTLGDELKLIESYLDIERARFEERLSVEIDVPGELRSIRIPSLILQPLVENAIKHAVSENKSGGTVKISARMSGETGVLNLKVTDTGSGNIHESGSGNGTGLKNIEARLAAYYGEAAELSVDIGRGSGTEALIKIPIAAEAARSADRMRSLI